MPQNLPAPVLVSERTVRFRHRRDLHESADRLDLSELPEAVVQRLRTDAPDWTPAAVAAALQALRADPALSGAWDLEADLVAEAVIERGLACRDGACDCDFLRWEDAVEAADALAETSAHRVYAVSVSTPAGGRYYVDDLLDTPTVEGLAGVARSVDGSLRHLTCDFALDVAADGTVTFTYGRAPAAADGAQITAHPLTGTMLAAWDALTACAAPGADAQYGCDAGAWLHRQGPQQAPLAAGLMCAAAALGLPELDELHTDLPHAVAAAAAELGLPTVAALDPQVVMHLHARSGNFELDVETFVHAAALAMHPRDTTRP